MVTSVPHWYTSPSSGSSCNGVPLCTFSICQDQAITMPHCLPAWSAVDCCPHRLPGSANHNGFHVCYGDMRWMADDHPSYTRIWNYKIPEWWLIMVFCEPAWIDDHPPRTRCILQPLTAKQYQKPPTNQAVHWANRDSFPNRQRPAWLALIPRNPDEKFLTF